MTEVLERETSGQSDADTSVISMLDENEAQYQAERLRKFAKKFGSTKAELLFRDVQQALFK